MGMLELFYAVFGAIVGALLWEVGKAGVERLRERKAPHTGQWLSSIPQHGNEPPKEDLFEIRQKGAELFGSIARQKPEKQKGRRWNFRGRLIGRDFIAAFWGDSYGVWFLRKTRSDDWEFEGRYLSIHDNLKSDGSISGNFDTVPLKLVRLSKTNRV